MKQKAKLRAEITEILNKPGKFLVIKQWVDGGPINADDNNGQGYSEEEAIAQANLHINDYKQSAVSAALERKQ